MVKEEPLDDFYLKQSFGEEVDWNPLVKIEPLEVKEENLDIKKEVEEIDHETLNIKDTKVRNASETQQKMKLQKILSENGVTMQSGKKREGTKKSVRFWEAIKEVCSDPGVEISEEIVGKCDFRCPVCKKNTTSWVSMLAHVRKAKHAVVERKKGFFEPFLVKAVAYVCRICQTKMLSDSYIVGQHMKVQHGITSAKYKRFIKSLCQENSPKMSLSDSNSIVFSERECVTVKSRLLSRKEEGIQEVLSGIFSSANVSPEIGSKCQYVCPECRRKFSCWKTLAVHLAKTKHEKASIANMERFIVSAVVHVCKICGLSLLCDMYFVNRHFIFAHKSRLSEYCTLYGGKKFGYSYPEYQKQTQKSLEFLGKLPMSDKVGNMCTFHCNKCNSIFDNCKNYLRHVKMSGHGKYSYTLSKLVLNKGTETKLFSHKCRACSQLLLCDRHFLYQHITRKHKFQNLQEYSSKMGLEIVPTSQPQADLLKGKKIVKTIGNHCVFACDQCSHETNSWKKMKRHLDNYHSNKHVLNKGNYIKKAVSYICGVCKARLLAEDSVIRGHIFSRHGMSVKAYHEAIILT